MTEQNKKIEEKIKLIKTAIKKKQNRRYLESLKDELLVALKEIRILQAPRLVKGIDYEDGKDGYTPVKGKDYRDGIDGYTPIKGKDYFDGYTPVRGVDYYTQRDIDILVDALKLSDKEIEAIKEAVRPIKGKDYGDGKDGYTPVKGRDYFTDVEVKSIIDLATSGFKVTTKQVVKLLSDPKQKYEDRLSVLMLKDLNKLNFGGAGGTGKEPTGAQSFLQLSDTPATYFGQALKGVRVNAGANALEFYQVVDTDEKVKYDASDPTAGYVADKFVAGTGISLAEGTGANENKLQITNSAPDQTVSITDSGIATVTGTYPNFNIDVPATDLTNYFNKTADDTDDITDTATNRFTNDTDITRLANTSGINTGDQDLSGYALLDGTNQPFTGNITIDKQEATLTLSSDTDYVNKISFKNNNIEVASFVSDQANTTLGFDTTLEDFYINSGARFYLQSSGNNIFYIDNTYARVYKPLGIRGVPQAGVSLDVYGQVVWLGSDSNNNRGTNTNKSAYIAVPTYTGGTNKSMFAYIDNYSGNNNIWIGGGASGYQAATKTSFIVAPTAGGTAQIMADITTAGFVWNENSFDSDFRIESDTDANNFFSDGGTNRIGIGTGTPGYKLDVVGDINTSTGFRVGGVAGASGTFTTADAKTVTVTNGIITSIV